MHYLEFAPPCSGIEGEFNTFRLGLAWSKRVEPGQRVMLVAKKGAEVIGEAVVVSMHMGSLTEMSALHASRNHNQTHLDQEGAAERLIAAMIKRYGPNRCNENSRVTVLYLRRIE